MIVKNLKPQSTTLNPFPPAWLWLIDEAIPQLVKAHYSPRESWKTKPFSKEDAHFFFKGIHELSELFTEERPKGMPPYFLHPKYRSAYLLYFLPLQAAKFLTLFSLHAAAIEAALLHAGETGILRVADLGSGPGTASLSLLLLLLQQKLKAGQTLPQIELHWFDTNESIMKDGKTLVDQLSNSFPKLRDRVTVHLHTLPWWKASQVLADQDLSLTFVGHVLNESSSPQREWLLFWKMIFERTRGGGVLLVEPAARKPAQILSSLRNELFESGLISKDPSRIWGPCLHSGNCPLTTGRDWCHFSVPTQIPGQWFKGFSEALSSERQWVKFSYLWFASVDSPSPRQNPKARRVISDSLSQGPKAMVLICEPDIPGRWTAPTREAVYRGDIIKLQ